MLSYFFLIDFLDGYCDSRLMIPPWTKHDVLVKRLVIFLFYVKLINWINLKRVLVLKGTSDITACQCLALLSTSGLVSGGARGAMAPPKFFCQENFMKNLLGKFHVLGLAQYCLAVLGLAQYQWPR